MIFAIAANRLSPTPLSKLASTEMVYANAPTPTRITLCQRGPIVVEAAALPASAWTTYNVKRAGRYRLPPHPPIHEQILTSKAPTTLYVRSRSASSAMTSPPC